MTAYRFVTLTCDECGEIFDSGNSKAVSDARGQAKAEGWQYRRHQDLCPRHFGYIASSVIGWVYMPDLARKWAEERGYGYYQDATSA